VKSAPHLTPIGRVDDVLAAKHPIVTFRQLESLTLGPSPKGEGSN